MSAPTFIYPPASTGGTPVGGSGTPDTIPRWATGTTLGNSIITQSGSLVTVGGSLRANTSISVGGAPTGYGILQLVSDDTATAPRALSIRGATDGNKNIWVGYNTTSNYGSVQAFIDGTGASPLALNPSGGNVGIGTASPAVKFHVNDGTNKNLRAYGAASGFQLLSATDAGGEAPFTLQGSTVTFTTAGAGRATINNVGQLLVGTASSPAYSSVKLVVNSAGGVNQYLYDSGSSRGIYLNAYNSGGSGLLEIGGVSGALGAEGLTNYMRISSTAIDASFVSGYGIKLPATPGNTDSQTLDCYQDGGALNSGGVTWTPTVAVGGSTAGVAYAVQVGRYTRIGNTIIAHGYVKLTSNGTGTGSVTIGGLPTSSNTADLFGSGSIGFYANITTTGQLCLRINPNSTSLTLTQTTPAGAATAITDTQFADTGEILFTVCYPAT